MMLSVKAVRLESTERWAEHIATAKGRGYKLCAGVHTRPSTQATTTGKARALNSPHTRRTQAHSASQRQHWRGQRRAHQHITKRAPGHKETPAPSADIAGGSELFVRSTSAPNDTPQTCLQTRAPSQHFGEGLRSHWRLARQWEDNEQPSAWLPAPPLQGGQQGSGAGSYPAPAHHLAPGTSNCRNECTSHSPASSSPAAGVEYFHPQTV